MSYSHWLNDLNYQNSSLNLVTRRAVTFLGLTMENVARERMCDIDDIQDILLSVHPHIFSSMYFHVRPRL